MDVAHLLRRDMLPRKCDVIKHVKYLRESGVPKTDAYIQTAKTVSEIWESADCPPIAQRHIKQRIENLVENEFRKPRELKENRKGKHKRTTAIPEVHPVRRSARIQSDGVDMVQNDQHLREDSNESAEKQETTKLVVKTRHQIAENISSTPEMARLSWLDTDGLELFDVLSTATMKKKDAKVFDEEFYKDQKKERIKKIEKRTNEQFMKEQEEVKK